MPSDSHTSRMMAPDLRAALLHNAPVAALYEQAVRRGEGQATRADAFAVVTGMNTGRSAAGKFVVRDSETDSTIWRDNAKALTPAQFDALHQDFLEHASQRNLFVQDLFAGADETHWIGVRIFCEYAWHALFIRHLLLAPRRAAQPLRAGFYDRRSAELQRRSAAAWRARQP